MLRQGLRDDFAIQLGLSVDRNRRGRVSFDIGPGILPVIHGIGRNIDCRRSNRPRRVYYVACSLYVHPTRQLGVRIERPETARALAGFLLLGPYSYLAGAMSLDFGGMRGSATASGIIDGVGYLAGYLAGDSMARVTVAFGWNNAFRLLACAAFLTTVVAAVLLYKQRSSRPLGTATAEAR